jgi:hypothetical protein
MPPRARLAPGLLAALACCACAAEIAGREPFSRADIAGHAAQAAPTGESKRTRAEVRESLGAPWLASERRRVDVFRTTGKQRNALIIFAPYPFPFPSFSDEYEGITLVSYDAAGRVEAVDTGFSTSDVGAVDSSFGIAAGDYLFVRGTFGQNLSVSPARFLADLDGQTRTSACHLMVGCNVTRPQRVVYDEIAAAAKPDPESGAPCWNELAIDGGEPRRLPLLNAWLYRALASWPSAAAQERGSLVCFETSGVCSVTHDFYVPLRLEAGVHQLRFTAKKIDGEITGEISCQPGDVVFTKFTGSTQSYSFGKQLLRGFKLGAASGRVELTRELPPDLSRHTVLLSEGERWLLPEEAALSPEAAAVPSGSRGSPDVRP